MSESPVLTAGLFLFENLVLAEHLCYFDKRKIVTEKRRRIQ